MKKLLTSLFGSSFLLSTSLFVTFQPVYAQSVTQQIGAGMIDWTQQKIRVTGQGAPPENGSLAQKRLMAKRAAQADAYRQLAEMIEGVQVDAETIVKNYVTESDTIRLRVSALIKAVPVGAERYLSDGSVAVDLEMPLYGNQGLASALEFDKIIQRQQQRFQQQGWLNDLMDLSWSWIAGQRYVAQAPGTQTRKKTPVKPLPRPTPQPTASPHTVSGYTGLIIDARGLKVQPAMSPAVLAASQQVYIGNFELDIDRVIAEGIIAYHRDLKGVKRAGERPLVVKATETSESGVDLLISAEDAAHIQAEDAKTGFLSQLNVAVIL